ncbi:tRNA-specific adenosine deaminase [Clostridium sp. N3C]|uniref:nucleoside deaminase n=1 Tax=Clostridium sp. N3C TaxID=1776758 RepID=UPI00092E168C|nr:nucleoside deaminase [Clostridium sp. N3C]SCN23587.1 tRNA-specific adenosine deaminase [Clostridium sp. N3C]
MEAALEQARLAFEKDEVPVGAVIVKDGQIISAAHNLKETLKDVTAHAEILAIRKAETLLDNWRLTGCSMYVTLEPCAMCASAIAQSRISNLYIGSPDIDRGACGSVINIIEEERINNYVKVFWTYNEACSKIITNFFRNRR